MLSGLGSRAQGLGHLDLVFDIMRLGLLVPCLTGSWNLRILLFREHCRGYFIPATCRRALCLELW